MAEPGDRRRVALRALAASLDDAAPAIGPAEAARSAGRAAPDRRPLLALSAAFVAIVGAVTWLVVDGGPDDDGAVVSPGPGPAAATTTSSSVPEVVSVDLPDAGLAVQDGEGPWWLFDLAGRVVGRAPAPDEYYLGNGTLVLRQEGDRLELPPPDGTEVPEGCASASAGGGVRVALCGLVSGSQPQRIDIVGSDGVATTLIGTPSPAESPILLGSWRWAIVSPDGRWVLAQWSAECEVPHAFVLSTDGSAAPRAVIGQLAADGDFGPASYGLGWAPDGRALVNIRNSGCSLPAEAPGTYLLDPATGELELLRSAADDEYETVYAWTKDTGLRTAAERLLSRAIDGLGLEPCCDEPAHDGVSATLGVVYEGDDLPIRGGPVGAAGLVPGAGGQRLPLLAGEAVVDAGTVYFTCGEHTWAIGWASETTPEVDSMLLLAEDLVPHLACTLRAPPSADG